MFVDRDGINGALYLKQSFAFCRVLGPLVPIIYRLLKYSSSRRFTYSAWIR